VHEPDAHAPPVPQEFPHIPQFAVLVRRSTQLVPQAVCSGTLQMQAPAVHADVVGHARPHAPQLARSVIGSMHAVPQAMRSAGHVHAPATQTAPEAHA
jgi:hypothetical protein